MDEPGSNYNLWRALIVLAVTALATFLLWLSFYYSAGETNETKDIIFDVLLMFASLVLIDKVGDVASAIQADREKRKANSERAEILARFKELPAVLLGTHDVIYFPSHDHGSEHCISLAKKATRIRNTVLRYGYTKSTSPRNAIHLQWIQAKKDTVAANHNVTEIVSKYFEDDDPQFLMMRELETDTYYKYTLLDDKAVPMMQMTIFALGEYDEVVFGWDFPDRDNGPCFASRNVLLIGYLSDYFDHHYAQALKQAEADESAN